MQEDEPEVSATQHLTIELLDEIVVVIDAVASQYGWSRDETISGLVSAGAHELRTVERETGRPLNELSKQELRDFKDARLMQLEARYSVLNFQNYRLRQDNDAQAQNLTGLMPQFEAAVARIHGLESEIRRLRGLVPDEQRRGPNAPFVPENERSVPERSSDVTEEVRRVFGPGARKGEVE